MRQGPVLLLPVLLVPLSETGPGGASELDEVDCLRLLGTLCWEGSLAAAVGTSSRLICMAYHGHED